MLLAISRGMKTTQISFLMAALTLATYAHSESTIPDANTVSQWASGQGTTTANPYGGTTVADPNQMMETTAADLFSASTTATGTVSPADQILVSPELIGAMMAQCLPQAGDKICRQALSNVLGVEVPGPADQTNSALHPLLLMALMGGQSQAAGNGSPGINPAMLSMLMQGTDGSGKTTSRLMPILMMMGNQ